MLAEGLYHGKEFYANNDFEKAKDKFKELQSYSSLIKEDLRLCIYYEVYHKVDEHMAAVDSLFEDQTIQKL